MTQKQVDLQMLLEEEQQKDDLDSLQTTQGFPMSTPQDMFNPLQKTMESSEKELNRGIYLSDNAADNRIAKKKQPSQPKTMINRYSSTKVKARNFLSNVSYNRVKKSDYQNRSFVIDCFSFLLLYLNPFYLERKFESVIERDYVNLLWSFMMPETFYNFICNEDNFKTLNKLKLKFHKTNEIVKCFAEEDSSHFDILKDYLIKHATSYQFIYGNLFPRYFGRIDDYGIQSKTNFNVFYKNYLNQKNIFEWRQNSFLATLSEDTSNDNNNNNNNNNSPPSTPLNMIEINDENIDLEKLKQIKVEKEEEEEKVDKTTKEQMKKKKNAEKKRQKRQEKKRKLEEKLIDNTEKFYKIKKKKINT